MSFAKKPWFWIVCTFAIVLGAGGFLWTQGMLPFAATVTADAATDTTQVADAAPETDNEAEEEETDPPVPVELALVGGRGIASYYRAASVIEADRLVQLVCRTKGQVRAMNVEEGDWVETGRILAELENEREKIQLRKAELTLADRQRQLDRSRQMLDQELISRQEFDDLESAWHLAEAECDLARIALEDTRVRAPFTGRVTERLVVAGQQVSIGETAFTLGDFEPLRVRAHLPETIARKVEIGQRVLIMSETNDQPLEALIERICPVVDPATSTVRLTMQLSDAEAGAQVGGFVKIRITTEAHHDALAIPKLALVEEGAMRSVFVAEADTVRKVEIATGLYDESHVEILEGLSDGDFVVTMGQGGLRTGTAIEPLNAGAVGYPIEAPASGNEVVDNTPSDGTVTAMAETD